MLNIVLVGTAGEENIGAIARAMMNMEVEKLILVCPECNHLGERALQYAVHAGQILRNARVCQSITEATVGSDLRVAISRRIGQWRKRDFILSEFAQFATNYRERNIHLVFGREASGLSNEELLECDIICTIPSSKEFPSLNLSHAVMVVLYELYQSFHQKEIDKSKTAPVTRERFDEMMEEIIGALDEMNFFKNVPKWRLESYIKKILVKADLDTYKAQAIKNIFRRIRGKTLAKKKNKNIEGND